MPDAQGIVRRIKECDVDQRELKLLREKEELDQKRIQNLEKELDLAKQELQLKDQIIAVKDMEIAAKERAFNDMKEISDRSLKLAEQSKPKISGPLLTTIGIIVGAIIIGIAL